MRRKRMVLLRPSIRKLLDEHLATWPKSSTADDARLWLGRLHQSQGKWQQAIVSYQAISPTHRHHAVAVRAAVDSLERRLAALKAKKKPTEATALEAAVWLEGLAVAKGADWPKSLDKRQCEALLDAAMLQMRYAKGRHGHAEEILRKNVCSFDRDQRFVASPDACGPGAFAGWTT